jgi:CHAT domain-containing protein
MGSKASKRLFKELLFPLRNEKYKCIENLIIIPDGHLFYLPFETLTMESDFLISKYNISYAPSVSSFVYLYNRKVELKEKKKILAFGNPIYSMKKSREYRKSKSEAELLREFFLDKGFSFSPLPFSEREIREIMNFFHKQEIDVFLGSEAKEEVKKQSFLADYRVIHFACHGFVDERIPSRSALVLTLDNDSTEDGFLQVREIYSLRLNTDMVVLSACQTGKGKLEHGEGVVGLPRVFFYAGARSVVTSLWNINDESTAEFMKYYYGFLSEGKNKGYALRLAKMKMISSHFSHPYYWAAFVLNGDWQSSLN